MPSDMDRSTTAKVVVATTVALSFISFWRAAAVSAERPRLIRILRGWHRRARHRKKRPLVHPGGNAVQLCRALDLHGIEQHVRARRRLRGGARFHGSLRRAAFGLLADLRLHPHRTHQRGKRRPVPGASSQRDLRSEPSRPARAPRPVRRGFRRAGDHLLLVEQHQGHSRIQRQGAAHHADHHGHGGGLPDLVPHHPVAGAQGDTPARSGSAQPAVRARGFGLVPRHRLAADRLHRDRHRLRTLAALHERF